MQSCEDYVLAHCKKIYGIKVLYRNRAIYIQTEEDTYRVDLSFAKDKIYGFCSVNNGKVLIESNLARGFFRIAAYSTYREIGLIPSFEDWEKFLADAYHYEKIYGGY